MTKWPVQKPTHRKAQAHAEHQDATDIENTYFWCFSEKIVLCKSCPCYKILLK